MILLDNEMDFLADFLVLRRMTSICTSCKCDIFCFVYLRNKREGERESHVPPLACQLWPPVKGALLINHCRLKKKKSCSLGDWRRVSEGGVKNALHAGWCVLLQTARRFPPFPSKLLKTTLWTGRWSMSLLLHAISHHHPHPQPPCTPHFI